MARSRKNDLVVLPTARATYGVVLLLHGSPDPRARLANDLLSRRVGHRLNAAVSLASLDHDKARLDGAVAHLQERDINDVYDSSKIKVLKGLDAVLKASGFRPAPDTGVVLASAGSAFESARARHAALALEWRSHGWGGSAVAFASGPGPRVSDAVATLRESGLERIVVSLPRT